ncbi:Uncharacterised protein [Pseudomonas aeruginosa]|nr:Uncharacterised protein [Pseudomonas aeruginosa]
MDEFLAARLQQTGLARRFVLFLLYVGILVIGFVAGPDLRLEKPDLRRHATTIGEIGNDLRPGRDDSADIRAMAGDLDFSALLIAIEERPGGIGDRFLAVDGHSVGQRSDRLAGERRMLRKETAIDHPDIHAFAGQAQRARDRHADEVLLPAAGPGFGQRTGRQR